MEVIGLAGGIAAGKSTVAAMFVELGASSLDADRIGHEVLLDPVVKQELRARFGAAIFSEEGEVIRARLAGLVFGSDAASRERLLALEAISHPRISQKLASELARLKDQGVPAAILDAAVMFKAGWDRLCTRIVFIRVPYEIRLARTLARGWQPGELDARENLQTPLAEKERLATDLIDNPGSDPEALRSQARSLWQTWGLPLPAEKKSGKSPTP